MTEIENFLHKNICEYLIDYFQTNKSKSKVFNKRYKIYLSKIKDDNVIRQVVSLYKSLRPTQKLENIELIFWPEGEYHDWHDDTIYYDFTTITYLNDKYIGGLTHVENYCVTPKQGKIILFDSSKKHMVTELEKGTRYVILAWYKNG